jgi:hypothetical protein
MAYNTKVIIFVGSASTEDAVRVAEAAAAFAENHARVASFEHITEFFHPNTTSGHGEVIVGAVNHLIQDELLGVLRLAARNPAWKSDFAPLVVICRGDDDDSRPATHTLDVDGHWHSRSGAR